MGKNYSYLYSVLQDLTVRVKKTFRYMCNVCVSLSVINIETVNNSENTFLDLLIILNALVYTVYIYYVYASLRILWESQVFICAHRQVSDCPKCVFTKK